MEEVRDAQKEVDLGITLGNAHQRWILKWDDYKYVKFYLLMHNAYYCSYKVHKFVGNIFSLCSSTVLIPF